MNYLALFSLSPGPPSLYEMFFLVDAAAVPPVAEAIDQRGCALMPGCGALRAIAGGGHGRGQTRPGPGGLGRCYTLYNSRYTLPRRGEDVSWVAPSTHRALRGHLAMGVQSIFSCFHFQLPSSFFFIKRRSRIKRNQLLTNSVNSKYLKDTKPYLARPRDQPI